MAVVAAAVVVVVLLADWGDESMEWNQNYSTSVCVQWSSPERDCWENATRNLAFFFTDFNIRIFFRRKIKTEVAQPKKAGFENVNSEREHFCLLSRDGPLAFFIIGPYCYRMGYCGPSLAQVCLAGWRGPRRTNHTQPLAHSSPWAVLFSP